MTSAADIVCFDTGVLICAVRGHGYGGSTDTEILGARQLVEDLLARGCHVVIPAPVMTEYLHGVDPQQRQREAAVLTKRFVIAPFDAAAAVEAAEMPAHSAISADHSVPRKIAKHDAMIVAIAIRRGASAIYTTEMSAFAAYARGKIEVRGIPPPRPTQMALDAPPLA